MCNVIGSDHPFSCTSVHPPETKCSSSDFARDTYLPETEDSPSVRDLPPPNAAQHFRHSGWSITRNRIYRSLIRTDRSLGRRDSFADCGSHAYVMRSITNPTDYRIAGSTCQDRFCTPCATTRSRTISSNVVEFLKGKRARFLTLTTVQGSDGLKPALDSLYKSFATLRKTAFWMKHVTGGVAFLEIKYIASSHRWHPHLHCIIEGKYIPQKVLSSLWFKVTRDSRIVDIRQIKDTRLVARYVTKYASKPLNASYIESDDLLDEAIITLAGRRLATTFGTWRSVLLSDSVSDDGWEQIASLDDLLYRAALGDTEALYIANRLDAAATSRTLSDLEFPRPPPRTDDLGTIPDVQTTMFATVTHYL